MWTDTQHRERMHRDDDDDDRKRAPMSARRDRPHRRKFGRDFDRDWGGRAEVTKGRFNDGETEETDGPLHD